MFFKLHEGFGYSSLELAMQLQKLIWISRVGEWMKCMSKFTDKFVAGITLFMQITLYFLVEKKYECLSLTSN